MGPCRVRALSLRTRHICVGGIELVNSVDRQET
jgi:hypothetical protein